MKITFELNDNLLEEGEVHTLSFLSTTLKQEVKRQVINQLVEEYMKKAEFGDLGIKKQEIKAAVIDQIAEKALENYIDN